MEKLLSKIISNHPNLATVLASISVCYIVVSVQQPPVSEFDFYEYL